MKMQPDYSQSSRENDNLEFFGFFILYFDTFF